MMIGSRYDFSINFLTSFIISLVKLLSELCDPLIVDVGNQLPSHLVLSLLMHSLFEFNTESFELLVEHGIINDI